MERFCRDCGNPLKEKSKFCPGCGRAVAVRLSWENNVDQNLIRFIRRPFHRAAILIFIYLFGKQHFIVDLILITAINGFTACHFH